MPLVSRGAGAALLVAGLPARRLLPRRRDRASRAARAGAAARRRSPRACDCTSGRRSRASSNGLLETPRGRVRAPEVVVATNAWGAGWKPLSRLLTPFGSYVVLTEPVPELLAEIGWTGGEAITDCRMFLHYFRTTADGRVLMGSGSGPIGFRGRDRHALLGRPRHGRAGRSRTAQAAAGAGGGEGGARVGRPDRRLGRPPARLRHGARHADALRRRLHGQRRRAQLARRPDPRVARARPGRRVVAACRWSIAASGSCLRSRSTSSAGSVVRKALVAVEEAEESGRKPSAPARLVATLPQRLGLRVGTR